MITARSRVTLPDGLVYEVVGDPEDYSHGPFPTPAQPPTPYTVTVEEASDAGDDAHGNPQESWGPPQPVQVHGWAPPAAGGEPKVAGHDQVITDLELFVPPFRVVNLRRVA